jgi:DNA-binding NtrC family response regulator
MFIIISREIEQMEKTNSILVIDDEKDFTQLISEILERFHFKIDTANDGKQGIHLIKQNTYDLVILDLYMPSQNGFDILKEIRAIDSSLPVLILSGDSRVNTIEQAMTLGANDFLYKPIEWNRLEISVKNAIAIRQLKQEINQLKGQISQQYNVANLIGNSKSMKEVFRNLEKVIQSDITLCIHGEHGTGKELLAKVIHFNGNRKDKPFIAINCSVLPESIFDEELFGAVSDDNSTIKYGKFDQANGGTLYLDEIDCLSPATQFKILKVLQENKITPKGATKSITINTRIIVGTDKNLGEEVKKGNFREDLFYRIHVYPISLPSLRQRKEDIPLLINNYFANYKLKNNKLIKQVSDKSMEYFANYDWPGNIRELENVLERALLLVEGDIIQPEHLPMSIRSHGNASLNGGTYFGVEKSPTNSTEIIPLEEIEKVEVIKALQKNNYNMASTALKLGIGRTTLYRKLEKHNIKLDRQ